MPQIVTGSGEVIANIRRYHAAVSVRPELQLQAGRVHAWYAYRESNGNWLFGPSKFVGYRDNTVEQYLQTRSEAADGRLTERALEKLFPPAVDPETRLGHELTGALEAFLRNWGKSPRSGARITVVSETPAAVAGSRSNFDSSIARIVSNPKVCGGRPCIRGTRIRVSDILDMLAAGASEPEIVEDYPDLSGDDIKAALSYAARMADHRIIRAA